MKVQVCSIFIALMMCSCAAMHEDFVKRVCHEDGGYQEGMNHAKKGLDMDTRNLYSCPDGKKEAAMKGYRKGYKDGLKHHAATSGHNAAMGIIGSIGNIFKGGKEEGSGPVAMGKKWRCIESYGQKECGYDCIEAYGKVACTKNPQGNCVEAYGKIRCGINCKEDYGEIECEG